MKIGIIDSGEGGKYFLRGLKRRYPYHTYYLVMDKSNFPYGNKEIAFLFNRVLRLINALMKKRVKLIILACNTLSSSILSEVKKLSPIPIVGVIKGTCLYINNQSESKVFLLATKNTLKSGAYEKAIFKEVIGIEASKLIALIENNMPYEEELKRTLEAIEEGSLVILGCTHFLRIKEKLKQLPYQFIFQDEIFFL